MCIPHRDYKRTLIKNRRADGLEQATNKMKKMLKAMGLLTLMMMVGLVVSAFTKANDTTTTTGDGKYSCKVEIFLPNGNHYVQGNIEVYFHKASWSDEGGWAKYWVDSDGRCTISWDSKRGDYIERITFSEYGNSYVIKNIKLSDGGSYKLTASES